MLRLNEDAAVNVERYRVTEAQEAKKDDVRRNDEEGAVSVVRITTATEAAIVPARTGDFYVPLDQPLANVITAALEPETQSSYAANRVLTLPRADNNRSAFLPLYRLPSPLRAATVVWEGN